MKDKEAYGIKQKSQIFIGGFKGFLKEMNKLNMKLIYSTEKETNIEGVHGQSNICEDDIWSCLVLEEASAMEECSLVVPSG